MPILRLDCADYRAVSERLALFDRGAVTRLVSGLLTVPDYHAESLRLELLLHLGAIHCAGATEPDLAQIAELLGGSGLGSLDIAQLEDPPNDVFVGPVIADGSWLLFEGRWEANRFHTQLFLDAISAGSWPEGIDRLRRSVRGLLRLSEAVARRAGLTRWEAGENSTPRVDFVDLQHDPRGLSRRTSFGRRAINRLGIRRTDLAPFALQTADLPSLANASLEQSPLDLRPLLGDGDRVQVLMPAAMGSAIRSRIFEWCRLTGCEAELLDTVGALQRDVVRVAIRGLQGRKVTLASPEETQLPGIGVATVEFAGNCRASVVIACPQIDHLTSKQLDVDLAWSMTDLGRWRALQARCYEESDLVVFVPCGLGGRISVEGLENRDGLLDLPCATIEFLGQATDCSFRWLHKVAARRKALGEEGLRFASPESTPGIIAGFLGSAGRVVPDDLVLPTNTAIVQFDASYLRTWRVETSRRTDVHGALDPSGQCVRVARTGADALFDTLHVQPRYWSPTAMEAGWLLGLSERGSASAWIMTAQSTPADLIGLVWDAALSWLDAALDVLSGELPNDFNLLIHLRISEPDLWLEDQTTENTDGVSLLLDTERDAPTITLGRAFARLLTRPTNDGERRLAESLVHVLLVKGRVDLDASRRAEIASAAMAILVPNTSVRHIHLFDHPSPLDRIRKKSYEDEREVAGIDEEPWELRLAAPGQPRNLGSATACNRALQDGATRVWEALQPRLEVLDREGVIVAALEAGAGAAARRSHWTRVSRAMSSLYGDEATRVSAWEEARRGLAAQACQILVEMAMCHCPSTNGETPSPAEFDSLVAGIAVLVRTGGLADAARADLIGTGRVHSSGTVSVEAEVLENISRSFTLETQSHQTEEFDHSYEGYFRETHTDTPDEDWLEDSDLVNAFTSEYGVPPGAYLEAMSGLIQLGVDADEDLVATTRQEVIAVAAQAASITQRDAARLLNEHTLVTRPRWDRPPPGFENRDWYPWKYRRRLSLISRPLLQVAEDRILYSTLHLATTLVYYMEGIRHGTLPPSFFRSAEMQSAVGALINARGAAFSRRVADALEAIGWTTAVEVQMTQLGADSELGDIDVLAWRSDSTACLAIECKSLQTMSGITGIVDRLQDFRGEVGDRLGRHVTRVEWLGQHPEGLAGVNGMPPTTNRVEGYLVTNRPVPFQFTEALGLPSERILHLTQLVDTLAVQGD